MTQKMYIGPTIPGVVTQNRIFKDVLPERVQKRCEEDVFFKRLIVPVDNLLAARMELQDKSSVLAVSFNRVEKSMNE